MINPQIQVAKIIFGMAMQLILVLAAMGIWITVTVALFQNPGWPVAATESLLTLTLGYIYKYFFAIGRH
jgi:hypothetical protein